MLGLGPWFASMGRSALIKRKTKFTVDKQNNPACLASMQTISDLSIPMFRLVHSFSDEAPGENLCNHSSCVIISSLYLCGGRRGGN